MLELYYWPNIPGRGEFIRLVLEALELSYVDVARLDPEEGGGFEGVLAARKGLGFAPPILKDREAGIELSQTALICAYLAENHGLVPPEATLRWHARMVATTLMDAVSEVHDTHHPISVALTYEEQSNEAKKAAEIFRSHRLPEWLQYFERLSDRNGGHLVGSELTYVDLMLHQLLQGLRFAFPEAMARQKIPRLRQLDDEVAALEPLQRYWASERNLPFNQDGIFRRYPELDG